MAGGGEHFALSKSRFEAFSDGVFAIAITLLVLEFRLPSGTALAHQWRELGQIWPEYVVYVASFGTIGIMWLNHHAMLRYVERVTYGMIMANLLLLMFIVFLPFATFVLDRFGLTSPATVYYGLALVAISAAYNVLYQQVLAAHRMSRRRITLWNVVGLSLYPLATLIGYFVPIAGILCFLALAVFYMLPGNVRSASIKPTA